MISWLIIPIFISQAHPLTSPYTKIIPNSEIETAQNTQQLNCADPVLSRLQRHRIAPGETISGIAQKYNLLPETLIRFNSILQKGSVPVGQEILIPPFNGIRVEVPARATWRDLEAAYGVRADILFEVNGCQKVPKIVFIPGVTWNPTSSPKRDNYAGLAGYPLPSLAKIELGYGWQNNPFNQQKMFHSGIDLLAPIGTPVLAAESGIVAFAGQEGTYGNLVVVNHGGGRQTRYAHLSKIEVTVGQEISTGYILGAVGVTGQPDLKVPHLHFEVRYKLPVGWVAQDPTLHLKVTSRE